MRHSWDDFTLPLADDRRRRVAIVSDAVLPYHRGGKELRYFELTKRLATHADVEIYTMRWWADGLPADFGGNPRLRAICAHIPLYVNERRSIRQALLFGLACFRLLSADFDVLEADQIPFVQVFALRLVAAVKRKPFVVTWHEVWGRDYWRQYLGPAGLLATCVEKLAMRLPDHIIAASPQTAGRLRRELGERALITVAPNGIDLDAVAAAHPDPSPTDLVVVGRLIAHKRVDMLLDAVALLRATGVPLTLRVIGDGPERSRLGEQARRLDIADAVEFRSDVSEQKDIYSLLKAARVCVFPSAREGFGIAVLEALACGVPVITTSAPDNLARHLVTRSNRGVVCDPSPGAIADEILGVLARGDAAGTEADAEAGLGAWLTLYSWDATARKVMKALGV